MFEFIFIFMVGLIVSAPLAVISLCLGYNLRVLRFFVLLSGAWEANIFGINFSDGVDLIFLFLMSRRHSRCLPRTRPSPLRLPILLFDFLLIVGEHDIDGIPIILGPVSDFINRKMMSIRGPPRSGFP